LLNRPDLPDRPDREPAWPLEQVPPPGQDATLLAVVPIPGTGTSLAIVGYAIATSAIVPPDAAGEPEGGAAEPAAEAGASGLQLDKLQRRVWADGREIMLTFQEFQLLAFFTAHPSTVFSRADLVEQVWHRDIARVGRDTTRDARAVAQDSRTVDVHVSRLRRKLGPVYGECLVTEYRVGYQFRLPAA
jgi:DNA-binding winged helix-turn-helix (wHTH) protein